jgi:DNA-binding XRE family transcriptional regulator
MTERVRRRRAALGLSQADVAAVSGLSRQLIGTVETGRHVPNVGAALALARALETTVEDLFGSPAGGWEEVFGRPTAEGTPLHAARVGDRRVYAPVPNHGDAGFGWQCADGVFRGGRVELLTGVEPEGFAVAGCDPALGLAASFLPQAGPGRVVAVAATSADAAEALDGGRLHAALIHGRPETISPPTSDVARRSLGRWQVGVAGRAERAIDLDLISSGRATVARLSSGAEAQKALERALPERPSTSTIKGPIASGHLESARLVSYGVADFGVVMEPAARAYGLEFLPLEEHLVVLEVAEAWTDHPGGRALGDLFSSKDFARRLGTVGGYELSLS